MLPSAPDQLGSVFIVGFPLSLAVSITDAPDTRDLTAVLGASCPSQCCSCCIPHRQTHSIPETPKMPQPSKENFQLTADERLRADQPPNWVPHVQLVMRAAPTPLFWGRRHQIHPTSSVCSNLCAGMRSTKAARGWDVSEGLELLSECAIFTVNSPSSLMVMSSQDLCFITQH